ncbi:hypothetical protein PR048_029518 [Dryococelus australis]|uniref:Uncharacterized protein n=1 Tax=Dryococelus australis TaxID=614101 RepID=A0ABQ9GDL3_9NEOP|nr:hypothetical protein PR048_029518 [Dryococelus australis]
MLESHSPDQHDTTLKTKQPMKYKLDLAHGRQFCRPTVKFELEIISILRRAVRHNAQSVHDWSRPFEQHLSRQLHASLLQTVAGTGATVVEWLDCLPPTKANRVQSPAGFTPEFRKWEPWRTMPPVGAFSWGWRVSPVSPALSFRRCSKLDLTSPSSALNTSMVLTPESGGIYRMIRLTLIPTKSPELLQNTYGGKLALMLSVSPPLRCSPLSNVAILSPCPIKSMKLAKSSNGARALPPPRSAPTAAPGRLAPRPSYSSGLLRAPGPRPLSLPMTHTHTHRTSQPRRQSSNIRTVHDDGYYTT